MDKDKMLKRPYSIEQYDPAWAGKFKLVKKNLQDIFGSRALVIEHIGSTSIPGMDAKPVVDVLVVVERAESFSDEKMEMQKLGYESKDNYIAPDTVIFFKADSEGRKTENIHVCVKDSPKAIRFVTTRDYLRAHPERAKQYSDLKKELNKKFPADYPAYRAAKESFLNETERLTRECLH